MAQDEEVKDLKKYLKEAISNKYAKFNESGEVTEDLTPGKTIGFFGKLRLQSFIAAVDKAQTLREIFKLIVDKIFNSTSTNLRKVIVDAVYPAVKVHIYDVNSRITRRHLNDKDVGYYSRCMEIATSNKRAIKDSIVTRAVKEAAGCLDKKNEHTLENALRVGQHLAERNAKVQNCLDLGTEEMIPLKEIGERPQEKYAFDLSLIHWVEAQRGTYQRVKDLAEVEPESVSVRQMTH